MNVDISQYDTYEEACKNFEWDVPEEFNMADAVCGRWAGRDDGKQRVALFYESSDGTRG